MRGGFIRYGVCEYCKKPIGGNEFITSDEYNWEYIDPKDRWNWEHIKSEDDVDVSGSGYMWLHIPDLMLGSEFILGVIDERF